MFECNRFPEGSKLRQICIGSAHLPLHKINSYRAKWGLSPLSEEDVMSIPCNYQRTENNWWKCSVCGHVHQKPSSRAPVRRCGPSPTSSPKRPRKRLNDPSMPLRKAPKPSHLTPKPRELGDLVEKALSSVGITSERVTNWLGRPCGCTKRKEKLNNLSRWARRILSGEKEDAEKYLEEMIDE